MALRTCGPRVCGSRPWFQGVVAIFDQTAEGRTSDAEYIVLNSQYPLPRGAVSYLHRANHFVTLPGLLKRSGHSTLSAHAFKRGFWNRALLHPSYGFQRSLFRKDLGPGEVIGWGLSDGEFFQHLLVEIETMPQPLIAFLITLSMHPPFDSLPPHLRRLELGEWEGTPFGRLLGVGSLLRWCSEEVLRRSGRPWTAEKFGGRRLR